MRVAFVYNEVPNRDHSTDTYCAYLLLEALAEAGHEVTAFLLLDDAVALGDPATRDRWLEELAQLDIDIRVTPVSSPRQPLPRGVQRVRTLLRPRLEEHFPHVALGERLEAELVPLRPDVVVTWGNWPAVAAASVTRQAPKYAFVGDPPHLPGLFRQRPPFTDARGFSARRLVFRLRMRNLARMTVELLSRFDAVAATAAHHAEWLRSRGVRGCVYRPNVVPDWGGGDWQERRRAAGLAPHKPKAVVVGHVATTSNLSGLDFLAREVLPALEQELGEDGFEVHVCGGGTLPSWLEQLLDRPSVRLRGFVDDIVGEIFSADAFVVATPIELGIRVRIPYAWSTGACVVVHEANRAGLPELSDGRNALLSSDGVAMARDLARALTDSDLRSRVGLEGRRTYEARFAPEVTKAIFLEDLERLAARNVEGSRLAPEVVRDSVR